MAGSRAILPRVARGTGDAPGLSDRRPSMRRRSLCFGGRIACACRGSRRKTLSPPSLTPTLQPPTPAPAPTQGQEPAAAEPVSPPPEPATPAEEPPDKPLAAAPQPATDPVVAIIRAKLADPALRKDANADDLAALEAFYRAREGGPLWITDMGFSARGQAAIFEIEKADDWGLTASSFEFPDADALPSSKEAAGPRRAQARSRHSEIRPLRARRPVRSLFHQQAVRSGSACARSKSRPRRN